MLSLLRARSAALPRLIAPLRTPLRTLSTSALRRSDDHHSAAPVPLMGAGGKRGEVPTDLDQATGLERLQLLGNIEGIDVFDMKPLEMTRLGTLADPIEVQTLSDQKILGCTGFPADSHDVLWLACTVHRDDNRCPECGCVYKLRDLRKEFGGHGHGAHAEHH